MTDAAFVFNQDIRERSLVKQGAIHKKNGSKSRKCTLPSDHLTPKQKKALNGNCLELKMNEPCHNWGMFKRLSTDLQRDYISNLVADHGARAKDIAEMFNISANTFSNYCTKFNPHITFLRSKSMDDRWMDFITAPIPTVETVEAKRSDDEIIKDVFGIDFGSQIKSEPLEPEHFEHSENVKEEWLAPVERTESPKQTTGYNAVLKMNLDLKGSKAEIMQMMDAILGSECNYIMSIKITNADREEAS